MSCKNVLISLISTFVILIPSIGSAVYTCELPNVPLCKVEDTAKDVQVTWKYSNTAISKFKVAWGTSSKNYNQSLVYSKNRTDEFSTVQILDVIKPGNTLYFAVKAVSSTGQESAYSNEMKISF